MMTMPELVPAEPGTLAEALAQLQGRLPRVAKEHTAKVTSQKTGNTHTYAYADLTDVSEKLLPLTASLGLSFTACPTIRTEDGRFVLAYTLLHHSGETITGLYPLPDPDRLGPQDLGKAITYARRYALCAVTGLAPGGDDDDAGAAQQEHQQLPRTGTNASLREQGRMDRQQKSAHEQLAADTARPGRGERVERSHPRGPDPDDPWAQDAPVDGQRAAALRANLDGRDLTDLEDKPGTSTLEQQMAIATRLAAKGITSREDKLVFCGHTTGRDIGSSKELSYSEAVSVLRAADELEAVNA
jgi:ERF superfamily protein